MKKAIVLCIAFTLVLAGCTQKAAIVKEAVINDMNTSSAESIATLKIDTNLVNGEDEAVQPFVQALKEGLMFHTKQRSLTEAYTQISLVNPKRLTGTEWWPYEVAPSIDLFMEGDRLYLTSSIDEAVLSLAQEGLEGTNEEELLNVAKKVLTEFDYTFKQSSLEGTETVTLADGSKVETQKVNLQLDLDESVAVLIYMLQHLAKYPELGSLFSIESIENNFQEDLQTAIAELEALDLQELKEAGLSQELNVDLWVADKHLVQVDANLDLILPSGLIDEGTDTENVYVNVVFQQQTWNHNQEVNYGLPGENNLVTEEDLLASPELVELFAPESPVGFLAQLLALSDFPDDFSEYAFEDVAEGHWAYDYITTLRAFEMVEGVGNNHFAPKKAVTRAEFAKMIVEALGYEEETMELDFKDVSHIKLWAESYLQTAVANGILEGYEDQTLRPNDHITRSEMITILVRALDLPINEEFELTYADTSLIQPYAVKYVQTGTAHGLVEGRSNNLFAPKATTSRAEAATVIYRILFELEVEEVEVNANTDTGSTQ